MVDLVRDAVVLAYDDAGGGYPPLVFVHGAACNRRFWSQQIPRFCADHRVVAVDLRGHGESDAPSERYTVRLCAEDLASTCTQLGIERPVVIGHSLGGLVALDCASAYPGQVAAAVLIDSPLLPGGHRAEVVRDLVAGLRGRDPDSALRGYFARSFFGPYDDPATRSWILDQIVLTEPHVTSSLWEESLVSWDDEAALRECRVPLLYIDTGSPNADLARAVELCPGLTIARTIGSGHFSPLMVPEQVNAMLERFLRLPLGGYGERWRTQRRHRDAINKLRPAPLGGCARFWARADFASPAAAAAAMRSTTLGGTCIGPGGVERALVTFGVAWSG